MTRETRSWARRAGSAAAGLAVPLVVGLAVLGGCLVLRMVTRDAVAAAVTAFGIALALRTLDKGEEHAWPDVTDRDTDGSRRDVARLTWSLVGRDGSVSEAAVRRLREDALRRLARAGVPLPAGLPRGGDRRTDDGAGVRGAADGAGPPVNSPEAERQARDLLGEPVWTVLTAAGGRLPDLDDVERCIDAIERLVPTTDGRTTT